MLEDWMVRCAGEYAELLERIGKLDAIVAKYVCDADGSPIDKVDYYFMCKQLDAMLEYAGNLSMRCTYHGFNVERYVEEGLNG